MVSEDPAPGRPGVVSTVLPVEVTGTPTCKNAACQRMTAAFKPAQSPNRIAQGFSEGVTQGTVGNACYSGLSTSQLHVS